MSTAVPRAVRDAAQRARLCGLGVHARTCGERVEWIEVRSRTPLAHEVRRDLLRAGYVIRRPTRADANRVLWRWTATKQTKGHRR